MISAKLNKILSAKPIRSLVPISAGLCSSAEQVSTRLSEDKKTKIRRRDYRFAYPEFLPDCDRRYRNHTRELLERKDMIARRENTFIPEFYVGSIIAVTITNPPTQGPGKFISASCKLVINPDIVSKSVLTI